MAKAARSRAGRMRHVKIASKQSVYKVSCRRHPRHSDRALASVADLSVEHEEDFFDKEEVMQRVIVHYVNSEDSRPLGKLVEPFVEMAISNMVDAGYIIMNEAGDMIKVTPEAAKMIRKIDRAIQASSYESSRDKCFARWDHYRQRVGSAPRLTLKQLQLRVEKLENKRRDHKRVCPMFREDSDTSSLTSEEPVAGMDDVDMHDDQPIAGPSSTRAARQPRPATPDSASYLTPVSLTPSPSPTRFHSPPTLPELEVDQPMAGPSSIPMDAITSATPARKKTSVDPAAAFPTPASLPRRREETHDTLSPPPSPTPHGSLSHDDDDIASGMDIDHNSNFSSSSGPLQIPETDTSLPTTPTGFLEWCFKTVSHVVPFSISGLSSNPSVDLVARKLQRFFVAHRSALQDNEELTQKLAKALVDIATLNDQLQELTAKYEAVCDSEQEHVAKAADLVAQCKAKSDELDQAKKELAKYQSFLGNINGQFQHFLGGE